MSNFALDVNSSQGDIVSSLNYALANLGTVNVDANVIIPIVANVLSNANVVTTNSTTGQLKSITQGTISYLYNYVNVKYANNATGSIGFSSNSAGKLYYGVHNTSTGTISSNPADYSWYQVSGGFGTTKHLYYTPSGGGTVYFAIGTTAPSTRYLPVVDDTAIYLQNLANSIVQTNNINPGAVTNVSIAANTITGNNVQPGTLTALQIADRSLTNATIALGAITGNLVQSQTLTGTLIALNTITGNLVAQNTITGNLIVPGTITGNLIQANTITGDLVQANTIQGSSIVAGSITADQLAANAITVNTVVSQGATLNNFSSPGFWLNGNTGNARFGNIISIGNNLGVGDNAVIGNNLTVGTNATIGNNLYVGQNAQIGSNLSVGSSAVIGNNLFIGSSAQIGSNLFVGSGASIGNNLIVGQNAQIGGNLQVAGLITTGALNANTVATTTIVQGAVTSIFTNSVFTTSNVASPASGVQYPMGANVVITGVTASTSTFLVSASTGPALLFNSATGPGAVATYYAGFYIQVVLPDGTTDSVGYDQAFTNWVNFYINLYQLPQLQLSNLQLGPYNQAGTYQFFLTQFWLPGSPAPYNPTYLVDQGRTLSVQQIKR